MSTRLRYLYRAYRYRLRENAAELRFLCEHLAAGQVACDIGCHKGAYTYWMRRQVGPAGAVFAFEPQPGQVAYLREAFSAMGYDNVEIVPMAVSDRCGEMPLYVPANGERTHEASLELIEKEQRGVLTTQMVGVTKLDDFFTGRPQGPRFLKIDVEGHELAVLHGAKNTLMAHRPIILIECESRHRADGDVRPVFSFLQSLGYSGSFFLNGHRKPLSEFDPATHQRLNTANPDVLPRGYVNNFAFE